MARELLYEKIVLNLVFAILLGNLCRHSEAWMNPEVGVIPENKIICQGERLKVHCANASSGLTIYSAVYGRTEPGHVICPYRGAQYDKNYNCGEADVTDIFKTLCARKNRCRVKVNSAIFGDPCPQKHLYLNLVYSCEWQRRRPKVIHLYPSSSTATSTVSAPTSSLGSFSSITMFPKVDLNATSSSILLIQSTPRAKDPTIRITRTKKRDPEVDNAIDPLQVEQAGSTSKSGVGSLGILGALFVWLLFMQDHSSDYITVFCASAAGALGLAIIVGLFILYRHHGNKQHLHVREPKLHVYGSAEPKVPAEVDPFILGPIKTPPPDYMLEGYNWQRGGTLPHKNSHLNGTVVRTFSAKDVHTKELNGGRLTETPRYHRGPQRPAVPRRQDSSNMYLNPAYGTNKSSRIERGRHLNVGNPGGPKTKEAGPPAEAFYY